MRTCVPGVSAVGTTPGFRRSSTSTVVPYRAAIAPRVSPLWITYQRLGGAAFARVAVDDASARLTAGCAFAGGASERRPPRTASATTVTTTRKAAGAT
jgi:hypothetical protein